MPEADAVVPVSFFLFPLINSFNVRLIFMMISQGNAVDNGAPVPPAENNMWRMIKGLAFRMLVIYFISSMFRSKTPTAPPASSAPGSPVSSFKPSSNLFANGTEYDLYVYVSEDLKQPIYDKDLVWFKPGLVYGDWYAGPNRDSSFTFSKDIIPSQNVKNNGTLFLHVFVVKTDTTPYPSERTASIFKVHKVKQLNRFKKRRYKKLHNLLTGTTEASQETIDKINANISEEIISHWHPNMTINIIDDHTPWTQGSVPPPLDEYIEFEPTTAKYYPVVYLNDYWNLARDYTPINETVTKLPIHLTFQPMSMFKWQMYTAQQMRSKWSGMLGGDMMKESDEESDSIKEAFLETSPYLLALTVVISITHSIFEFMAFKNDIQFWKNRNTLEGLSVKSVFFNVFQSVIVLLYVLDNDTNTMVRISIGIGLLIEIWKVFKVTDVKIDLENKILGLIPRIRIDDKGSYVESSTKEFDTTAFKYLSWALFPLLVAYAVYSLIYHEHKGFYSWILSMLYGFLLTFGFIAMTPQLFINYKLKSVAHLPWRMLTYKFLNTFIDDIFAFVIKMPTMYRLGCFRDDIIFLIYVYQRYIYRVDLKRVNEFGVSGEQLAGVMPDSNGNTDTAAIEGVPSVEELSSPSNKKND